MSSAALLTAACLFAPSFFFAQPLWAQYPGRVSTKDANSAPTLRAVGVLECSGQGNAATSKPKKCRLVPVSIYDGQQLQDAGLYVSQPQPLAVSSDVEYKLQQDGKTVGLFDVESAGQEQGLWVGFGKWKAAPAPHPANARKQAIDDNNWNDDDKPVLHRKHRDDQTSSAPSKSGGSDDDDARPTLHRKDSGDSSTASSSGSDSGSNSDDDRPVLKKKSNAQPAEDEPSVSALPTISDPDRPRLIRGEDTSGNIQVTPSLMGLPADMHQTVAVSDAQNHPDHPWNYEWANPADEAKMKTALEEQARIALGMGAPAQTQAPATTPHRKAASRTAHKKTARTAPEPLVLEGEQFRTFQLAYDNGATLVLSAYVTLPATQTSTDHPQPPLRKFVTLIAQPDLYGNLLVLFKNVTDSRHLDETPRMILVDAVDALADNRGELLFELRGAAERQFALYRVLRGSATQIFATTGGIYSSPSEN